MTAVPQVRSTTVVTGTPEQTEAAAAALAESTMAGYVVGLSGPLGAGKTCFARGFAAALGADPTLVASPTFTYLYDYPVGESVLYHADLYRLSDLPAEAAESAYESIGLFAAFEGGRACLVEWWDHYRGPVPAALVRVEFTVENTEHRRLTVVFETPDSSRDQARFRSGLTATGLATHA